MNKRLAMSLAVATSLLFSFVTISISAQNSSASEEKPERFGFGRDATDAEIQKLDIDVMPDGTGLPEGSGTVETGAVIYSEKCAWCHGDDGTGGNNDVLVGRDPREGFPFGEERGLRKTIGNYWPYATTLYDYTFRSMPFDKPGTLTPDEVYSLVAFLLHANEIIEEDVMIDAESLPEIVMPAHGRFVEDDRRGGKELR